MLDRRSFAKTAAALPIAISPIAGVAAQAMAAQPLLISREAYPIPFEDYAEWLGFMDRAPDPAWDAARMRELVSENAFDRYANQVSVRAERVKYRSDGLAINAFAFTPRDIDGPLPLIVFAHGGVAQWGRITFFEVLEMMRLAERGYCVLASALRGEGGSEGQPNLGAGDRQDMLNLIDLAPEITPIDERRIGYWGFSRGGGLGYRTLAATDKIAAAVLIGAPSDAVNSPRREEFHEHVYPGIVDGYDADPDAALQAISAAYWPERIAQNTKIMLIHGAKDDRVDASNSLTMASHFARLDRSFETMILEDGSHTLIEHHERVRAAMDRWFDTHLASAANIAGTD